MRLGCNLQVGWLGDGLVALGMQIFSMSLQTARPSSVTLQLTTSVSFTLR